MVRSIRSVSLPPELNEVVENNIPDFSAYIQEKIEKDFLSQYQINEKIKKHEKAIKELQKINISISPKINSDEEKTFLNWAKKNIEKNPGELFENCRVYNFKFGKRLTQQKFRELVG